MSPLNRFALCAALLSVALLAGCKKETPVPTANPGAPPSQEAVTLNQLSLELRRFVVRTRTVPKTFEEFVSKAKVQVPPPPSGKKYVIEGQAVVLKNL